MARADRRFDAGPEARDLATGVGLTATMVAAARAVATTGGLISDQFAAPLVQAVGVELLTRVADGEEGLAKFGSDAGFNRVAELFAARTGFFDSFLVGAAAAGIRQVVVLASGLDSRAYRLWWPDGTTLYEIDQPRVIAFKTATLRALGAVPTLNRRAVGVDLRHDWPAALKRVGFDASVPTGWIAEGLLIGFLPPDVQDRLLDSVTGLSAAGSRFAADHPVPPDQAQADHEQFLADRWRQRGLDIDFDELIYHGERNDVARHLAARGWTTTQSSLADLFVAARLPQLSVHDLDGAATAIGYLTATRG